ncbi:MAG TPA: hypothetical protein DIT07_12505 [Sphingobacteriaceae bacterium]|nr:hypothetical protein [Sphingobacteriaceae bacterium]
MALETEEWIISSKKTLKWFIQIMGESEWERRRQKVIEYFLSLDEVTLHEADVQAMDFSRNFKPIALYSDWMAWYMYLIESTGDRPAVSDQVQSSRIYPFFANIGRNIDSLKKMKGIDDRLNAMLNEHQNMPDSTLFELAVAALYKNNGWSVEFLKERLKSKTPDLKVSKGKEIFWVECKRLAKVTDYSNLERTEWQKRFKHLTNAMRINKICARAEVIFKIPVEEVPEEFLGAVFYHYIKAGMLNDGSWLKHKIADFKAVELDIKEINERLALNAVRANSPQMIELITGNYDPHGSYTQLVGPSEILTAGPEDGLHVLNKFYGGIHVAYSCKWECIAEISIDKKAKEIKKALSKAVNQIPDQGKGIVHIGYETVNGPLVEQRRYSKTQEIINGFDFEGKTIEAIYCHAIQPLCSIEDWECAETTIYFEQHPGKILNENLLLSPPGTTVRNDTHWEEDLNNIR